MRPQKDTPDLELWNAVYNSVLDPEEGRKKADQALDLIRKGRELTRQEKKLDLWANLRWKLSGIASFLKIPSIILACCFALSAGIWGIFQIPHPDHYANESRRQIPNDSENALKDFFSPEPVPFLLTKSITESVYLGIPAWRVVYETKGGNPICAFIWRRDAVNGGASSAVTRDPTCVQDSLRRE